MITVRGLTFYPLKGARGITTTTLELDRIGPRFDRRWMVVTEAGHFLTQRELPTLYRVGAVPGAGSLTLSAPGQTDLQVPVDGPGTFPSRVRIWGDECEAVDQGDLAADWCTSYFDRPCRLVFYPDAATRRTDPAFDPTGSPVGFADAFPMLLIGTGSLAALNAKLDRPVPMARFRPNVVVEGIEPFAEDRWRGFSIGATRFEAVKPCARCVVTTIDQETGERGAEPLRTLATFRRGDSGALFGMNVVHRDRGTIAVGDVVRVD